MTKYMNRPALTPQQESEIYPLLDAALQLPFGKAIVHQCPRSRASYLARVLKGERYRNALQTFSTYLPSEPLYGKGLYYHIVIDTFAKGVLIAHMETPPETLTWLIIDCIATRKPQDISRYSPMAVQARLHKLRERHIEVKSVYVEGCTIQYAIPSPEELIIVDVDTRPGGPVPPPTPEQRAKVRN